MYYSLKKRNTAVSGAPAAARGQLVPVQPAPPAMEQGQPASAPVQPAPVPIQPALPTMEQGQPASASVQPAPVPVQSVNGPRTTQPNNVTSRSNPLCTRAKKNVLKTLAVVSLCFAVCLGPNQIYYFLFNVGIPLSFSSPFFDFSVYMMVTELCH